VCVYPPKPTHLWSRKAKEVFAGCVVGKGKRQTWAHHTNEKKYTPTACCSPNHQIKKPKNQKTKKPNPKLPS
jgi:hypothetical protein